MGLKAELKEVFNFKTKDLKNDLLGGLLAAIIGLPMGLAFGVQSGLGPQAGIYTAIILPILASLLGGTRTLISDPTGPMTVVAAAVTGLAIEQYGAIEHAWPLIVMTFALAGIFEFVFGVLDLGKYVKYMPYPVLSGFMAGIGVIIISVQLFPLFGHASPKGFWNIISTLHHPIMNMNYQAVLLGAITIAIIYLFPLVTKKIPSILVALILGTIISVAFQMDVPAIGEIPKSLPKFHLGDLSDFDWSKVDLIITPAIMLGGLGVIDTLLTSVVADNLTKTKHNSRWTVIGQGIGNFITGLFGGIPGAGATMGTVTNIKTGASSKISGIAKGVFLLIIVVGIADYVKYIPMAVLAGILITIGIGIIDYKGIALLLKVPRGDAFVYFVVLGVTLFDNLLDAVAVGFVLAAIMFIGKMSKAMDENKELGELHEIYKNHHLPEKIAQQIYVKTLSGPLFFGYADQFRNHCEEIGEKPYKGIIVRMEKVPFLDESGLITLEEVIEQWRKKDKQVYITGASVNVKKAFKDVEIVPRLIDENHLFETFGEAVEYIEGHLNELALKRVYQAV